jgi:hypothetical protein
MSFSIIKEYYETLKDSYVLECKEEKKSDLKRHIGNKFNSLLIVLFILTVSQLIPLSILNILPEGYKVIPFYKIDIPTIIPINVAILLILKLLHHFNKENLVYAFIRDRKKQTRISPLQKAFSTIFTCLIKLRAYSETNDESQIKEAGEHYYIFQFMLPYDMFLEDKYLSPSDREVLQKDYRENYLPWFNLTGEQINDIETVKCFLRQLRERIYNKKGISDIMPALEALSVVYYSALKNKDFLKQKFLEFKQQVKTIPPLEIASKPTQMRIEEKVNAFFLKIEKNYLLYFSISFIGSLVAAFLLVYWPCRAFFNVSPETLAPVVFATAITLAFMDTQRNVKTDLDDKEPKEK